MRPEVRVALLAVAAMGAARVAAADGPVPVGPSGPPRPARRRPSSAAGRWSAVLEDCGIDGDPARWARVVAVGGGLAVAAAGSRAGPGAAVAMAAVLGVGAVGARLGLAGRGARRADATLPDLLEHAGRGIRSGLDLGGALDEAGRTVAGRHGAAARAVVARMEGGATVEEALDPWVEEHPRPPVRMVVAAIAVAAATGGHAAGALDGVAATIRARAAVADEARALASQARASAAVLVALPLVVAVGGAAADERVAAALLGTGWGRGCSALALALDAAGAWWMQRVVAAGGR